jgi:hypothetical protein
VFCRHDLAVHFCSASMIDAVRFIVLYVVLYVTDFAVHFGYASILDAVV